MSGQGKVDETIDGGENLSKGRREVLGKLALGRAYVTPMVLAGMTPTRAAEASAGGVQTLPARTILGD